MADGIVGKISVGDGATFTPHVSADGILTFTNNKNLPNPDPVDIAAAVIQSGAGLFLPLSGGTMIGMLKTSSEIRFYTDSGRLSLNGGNTGGAYLNMYGKDHAQWPGLFSLAASDGQTTYQLQGAMDGTLKWRNYDIALAKDVLALSGGTLTGVLKTGNYISQSADNSRLSLCGGSNNDSGAYLNLYGKGYSATPGLFSLTAYDGTTRHSLIGSVAGSLTWDNKNIEVVESSGTNYIRYTNGLQICWRTGANFDTNGTEFVLPVPFKDANYAVNVTTRGLTTSTNIALPKVTTKSNTGFVMMAVATSNISSFTGGTADYVAVGWWK